MTLVVKCGSCGKSYQPPDHLRGKALKCLACGARISVPRPESSAEARDGNVTCPNCHKVYRVGLELSGKPVRCQSCGATFTIPKAESEQTGLLGLLDDLVETDALPRPSGSKPLNRPRSLPSPQRGKSTGEIKKEKCPGCGNTVEMNFFTCPRCGHTQWGMALIMNGVLLFWLCVFIAALAFFGSRSEATWADNIAWVFASLVVLTASVWVYSLRGLVQGLFKRPRRGPRKRD